MKIREKTMKCSHCGRIFQVVSMRGTVKAPTHDFPKPCRSVCQGSGRRMLSLNSNIQLTVIKPVPASTDAEETE